nr:PREDICTED: uncharacterized protein LOC104152272 isoform X2 [Struthio camelus australis]
MGAGSVVLHFQEGICARPSVRKQYDSLLQTDDKYHVGSSQLQTPWLILLSFCRRYSHGQQELCSNPSFRPYVGGGVRALSPCSPAQTLTLCFTGDKHWEPSEHLRTAQDFTHVDAKASKINQPMEDRRFKNVETTERRRIWANRASYQGLHFCSGDVLPGEQRLLWRVSLCQLLVTCAVVKPVKMAPQKWHL